MINLAVINLKTLFKRTIKIIVAILILAMIIKFVSVIYHASLNFHIKDLELKSNIGMIQNNLAISKYFESEKENQNSELKKLLVAQLAVFLGSEEEMMEKENREEVLEFEDMNQVEENTVKTVEQQENSNPVQENQTQNKQTAVIDANNKKDIYTDVYQNVQIKNESKYSLTEAMVTPDRNYSNQHDIIIYHTHSCESYTPGENSQYVATGNYRTTDTNYSVVRVGEELTNYLAGKGYTAIHDKTFHDYPAYTGSYNRALSTITNLLSTYHTVDAVFDIHRDALRKQ